MTPIQALKDLPALVERKMRVAAEAAAIEADLRAAVAALGPQGWHYEQLVAALTRPEPAVAWVSPVQEPRAPWEPGDDAVIEVRNGIGWAPTVDQPAEPAADLVQATAREPPAEAVAADQSEPGPAEEVRSPPAEEEVDEEGWVSCKDYARTCNVSEMTIYNAIAKGQIHGDAVRLGPPKRVHPERADRQILQRIEPSLLRANVAKRVERSVVIEGLPEEERPLSAAEAARLLRGKCYQVLEIDEENFRVDGVATSRERLIERATQIRDRDERLARARRSAA